MKGTIIVIIACDKLSKDFCYLKQLEYVNGKKVDYVDVYACGAAHKGEIISFITALMDKYEYAPSHKENIKGFLKFLKCAELPVISEELKLSILRQMHTIRQDSWKYTTYLMSNSQYLTLGEDENSLLPHDIEDINFILKTLTTPPFQS